MLKGIVVGNMTRDAELRFVEVKGDLRPVCDFDVATNSRANGQEFVQFTRVTAWGGLAEAIVQYTGKGSKIEVWGRIQEDRVSLRNKAGQLITFEGEVTNDPKQAGFRTFVKVVATEVEFHSPNPNRRETMPTTVANPLEVLA